MKSDKTDFRMQAEFGSLIAGVLTNREGNCPKDALFHRTDEGALPARKLPEGDWLNEIKFHGYRALAFKEGKDVRLLSRNQNELDYAQLLDGLKWLPADSVQCRRRVGTQLILGCASGALR